ncbi:MAG: methyltransferase domain-containing protein [Geminicoccaceae bacterium]|nr:methyltransferase domain-containing protein [Geminicoccaceae bacterium]
MPAPEGPLFDRALRRRRRRARRAHRPDADYLRAETERRLLDRLADTSRRFTDILIIGDPANRVRDAVAGRYTDARITVLDELQVTLSGDLRAPPFAANSFDAVLSLLDLHAIDDLPGALAQSRTMLRPDGLFLAAFPGGETLGELRYALMQAELERRGGATARIVPLVDIRDAGALLQRAGFALPVADTDRLDLTYAHLLDLIADLRAIGETNPLMRSSRSPLDRTIFLRTAEIYAETFADPRGRIRATFDLLFMTGWKPDPSQPRPLAPGSARSRLADALDPTKPPGDQKPR